MNKYGIFVFATVIAVSMAGVIKGTTDEERAEFRVVHRGCQDDPETFADEVLIQKLFDGIFPEDDQLKVHMVCMYQGFNLMNHDGELNKDVIKKKWAEHVTGGLLQKLNQCLVKKSSPEETSWEFMKCQHRIGVSLYGR